MTTAPLTPVLSVRRVPSLVAAGAADRRGREDLAGWAERLPSGACALVRMGTQDPLLDVRSHEPLRPASTQKLLTATAALRALGADVRLRTTVVAAPAVAGVVPGDLTLVGGGDPLLATADYMARFERQPQEFTDIDSLAAAVAATGVTRIAGAVVGDESRYDQERTVAGWPSRYSTQGTIGPLSALSVNDGFAGYPTADAPGPLVPAEEPARHAAAVLTVALQGHGVVVDGAPRSGVAPADGRELAAVESPPLRAVVGQMLRESDNATAELLTKELGRTRGAATTRGGASVIRAELAAAGLDLRGVTIDDGSGLSLDDRVTCDLLVDLLVRPPTAAPLRKALAVAGRTGTLADRFTGTALVGHLHAKTGTLATVAALAGFLIDDADPELTFAYVVTAGRGDAVDEAAVVADQQRLGEILLAWPRAPATAALGPRRHADG